MTHTGVLSAVVGHHIHFAFWWTVLLTLMNIMLLEWMRNVIHAETDATFSCMYNSYSSTAVVYDD